MTGVGMTVRMIGFGRMTIGIAERGVRLVKDIVMTAIRDAELMIEIEGKPFPKGCNVFFNGDAKMHPYLGFYNHTNIYPIYLA